MESLPLPLLVFLIVLAIAVGLWAGGRAHRQIESGEKNAKPLGAKLRDAVGRGVVSAYRWNRKRKKDKAKTTRSDAERQG